MMLEILQKISSVITEWINNAIGTITSPLFDYLNSVVATNPTLAGYSQFLNGIINVFFPYQQITVGIALLVPVYLYNLVINVFFFIKSFIPLSGGNG